MERLRVDDMDKHLADRDSETDSRHDADRAERCPFGQEHADDLLRRTVTEQLTEFLFVIRNTMAPDHPDEILRSESRKRGFMKVWIGGDEVFRRAIKVGEITAAAAGDENLLAGAIRALQKCDAAPAFAGFDGAHEPGGSGAKNYSITMMK